MAFALQGKRTLFLDMNPFPDNSGGIFGLHSAHTFQDLLTRKYTLKQIVRSRFGIDVVYYGSRADTSAPIHARAVHQLLHFLTVYDAVVMDCRNVIPDMSRSLLSLAPLTLMVATPAPEAISGAYGLVKAAHAAQLSGRISLLMNRVHDAAQIRAATTGFDRLTEESLSRHYDLQGAIPETVLPFNPIFGVKPLLSADVSNPAAMELLALSRRLSFDRDATVTLSESYICRLFDVLT